MAAEILAANEIHSLTYCAEVYVFGLAPLFMYKSASLPISIASNTIPALLIAGAWNALIIAFASKKAAVMLS